MSDYLERTSNGTCFTGSDQNIFAALALAMHCGLYAKIKMTPNRHVSATDLLRRAESYTGKTYKRGAHLQASNDLTAWANARKAEAKTWD